jgi:hypothetical protein
MSKHQEVILTEREAYLMEDILTAWLSNLNQSVEYYEQLYDPEYKMNHGMTVAGRLELSREVLHNAKIDAEDQRIYFKNGHRTIYSPKGYQLDQALADIIRNSLRMADDFRYNKHIVMRRYRDAIHCLDIMRRHTPDQYEHVNCRYFLTNMK